MLVVGSPNSRIQQPSGSWKKPQRPSKDQLIDSAKDIDGWLEGVSRVGLTAGESRSEKGMVEQVEANGCEFGCTDQRDLDLIREDVALHAAAGNISTIAPAPRPVLRVCSGREGNARLTEGFVRPALHKDQVIGTVSAFESEKGTK